MTDADRFNNLMQKFADMPYDELVYTAKRSTAELISELGKTMDRKTISGMIWTAIAASLGADGTLSDAEHKFLNEVFGLDYSYYKMKSWAESGNETAQACANKFADSLSQQCKTYLASICATVLAVDRTIKHSEAVFLVKLLL